MRKEYNRLLCYLLGVIFLLWGAYPGHIRWTLGFGGPEAAQTVFSNVWEIEDDAGETCTLQMSTKKVSDKTDLSSTNSRKRILQEAALLLATLTLIYHFMNMREMERALRLPAKCSEGVIPHFIHNQDGKKQGLFV
ncbi:MAG: hypothetical protein PUI41_09970 [Lachnospiraceae bacterium]|nr:DUF2152 domain-containing protein [Lachnospiraceae bacterium]MDD7051227.1 hypothetical protein [Lachnospiraceae bacterium]MDY4098138.1 hypothetical protein [Lachnospiraceae bacterium]